MRRTALYALSAMTASACVARGDTIQSEIAVTVPQGASTVRLFARSTVFNQGASALEVQTQFVHGLTARTNLLLLVPVVSKQMDVGGVSRRATGASDATLLIKQQVWKRDALQTQDRVALIGGVKLPTGASNLSDVFGKLPPALQPGTGAFDLPIGVLFAHDNPRGFFADALYTFKTEANGYRFGNTLRYDLAYTHALQGGQPRQHFVWAVVELNGSLAARDRSTGQRVADSGGHVLFLSPGVRLVHWSGRYVLDLSYQIPFVTDLNINQPEPQRSWLLGFRLNF